MTDKTPEAMLESLGDLAAKILAHLVENGGDENTPFMLLMPTENNLQIIGSVRGQAATDLLQAAIAVLDVTGAHHTRKEQVH